MRAPEVHVVVPSSDNFSPIGLLTPPQTNNLIPRPQLLTFACSEVGFVLGMWLSLCVLLQL